MDSCSRKFNVEAHAHNQIELISRRVSNDLVPCGLLTLVVVVVVLVGSNTVEAYVVPLVLLLLEEVVFEHRAIEEVRRHLFDQGQQY